MCLDGILNGDVVFLLCYWWCLTAAQGRFCGLLDSIVARIVFQRCGTSFVERFQVPRYA